MEDKAPTPRISAADIAITCKYWETVIRKSYSQPEKELMLAVLKDALLNYRKILRKPNKRFSADRAWFFANDHDSLFSF